jgi:hypothetical protein
MVAELSLWQAGQYLSCATDRSAWDEHRHQAGAAPSLKVLSQLSNIMSVHSACRYRAGGQQPRLVSLNVQLSSAPQHGNHAAF